MGGLLLAEAWVKHYTDEIVEEYLYNHGYLQRDVLIVIDPKFVPIIDGHDP